MNEDHEFCAVLMRRDLTSSKSKRCEDHEEEEQENLHGPHEENFLRNILAYCLRFSLVYVGQWCQTAALRANSSPSGSDHWLDGQCLRRSEITGSAYEDNYKGGTHLLFVPR